MNKIESNNMQDFLKTYNNFHDSNLKNIYYDIINSSIEMTLDALEAKDDQLVRTDVTICFKDVKEFKMKEMFSWDFIYDALFRAESKENETLFLFADDIDSPNILILCKEVYVN